MLIIYPHEHENHELVLWYCLCVIQTNPIIKESANSICALFIIMCLYYDMVEQFGPIQ